jgi:hypothetical protein
VQLLEGVVVFGVEDDEAFTGKIMFIRIHGGTRFSGVGFGTLGFGAVEAGLFGT